MGGVWETQKFQIGKILDEKKHFFFSFTTMVANTSLIFSYDSKIGGWSGWWIFLDLHNSICQENLESSI